MIYLLNQAVKFLQKKRTYRPDKMQNQFTWQNASLCMGMC